MLFLVDFENVHSEGMRGCNLLEAADRVTVFYSDSSKNIEKSYLQEIEDSGCCFEIVRLVRKGKNALDF